MLWVRALRQDFLFGFLAAILLCGGCTEENQKFKSIPSNNQQLLTLPVELQKDRISFNALLNEYDNLNNEQRTVALEHILTQANLPWREQAEAAYMLARIYQQSLAINKHAAVDQAVNRQKEKEVFALFDKAKSDTPLRKNALWHISEVATISGNEKIVRQALNDLLGIVTDANDIAAARYALAQSYLRANQIGEAADAFKKIYVEFPNTKYALGSAYYLGTLDYTRLDQEYKLRNNLQQITVSRSDLLIRLEKILLYYLEYLQKSPSGRFAADILSKMEIISKLDKEFVKSDKLAIIANAYFANGKYKEALNLWVQADADKRSLEIADCLLTLGQVKNAQEKFFKGIEKHPTDDRHLFLAEKISDKLDKKDALRFWERLYKSKICNKDQVLWNLAIRTALPKSLNYYQQIVTDYPASAYTAEAQWRIFWQRIRRCASKEAGMLESWCYSASKKYSRSKFAPRFLFWAGKLSEAASKKQQAAIYYRENKKLYPTDYYNQRAKARYAYITNGDRDNYFQLQPYSPIDQRQWDWPLPKAVTENLHIIGKETVNELIYLKQYDEALAQSSDLPIELDAWLKGKIRRTMQAINAADKYLRDEHLREKNLNEEPSKCYDDKLLWQYAYPLLYNREIIVYCRRANIADPLFYML